MIACRNITKTYHNYGAETAALRNVTFSIAAGEFVAIMGPSGSGKSTLMNILGALDTPTSGTYILDGENVSSLSEDALADIRRTKIGFVFQSFNLLPRASVIRNVTLPLIYNETPPSERPRKVADALHSVELPEDRWEHLSNQLSGGQMQRVAIARALVNNPSLILADEPTGNLDTTTGEKVLETFEQLNKQQKRTIILITHEPSVADHTHRTLVIRDGSIIEDKRRSIGSLS